MPLARPDAIFVRPKKNLVEAVALVLERAEPAEIARHDGGDVIVSRFEVKVR